MELYGSQPESDDRMLPPRLRGYAPQITGIAETNARVVVSQQGRVLYDSMVPAGYFSIQDWTVQFADVLMLRLLNRMDGRKPFRSIQPRFLI